MNKPILRLICALLGVLIVTNTPMPLAFAADVVVGDGSPASCSETAFDAALTTAQNGGGMITFNCGSAVHTITFTIAKTVNLGNVTINGNNRIILNANTNERHFFRGYRRDVSATQHHAAPG